MNPFTVEWSPQAVSDVADAWLQATDRKAVNAADALIDPLLARNPLGAGRHQSEGLYVLVVPPLHAYYTVDIARRHVVVTDVRYVP